MRNNLQTKDESLELNIVSDSPKKETMSTLFNLSPPSTICREKKFHKMNENPNSLNHGTCDHINKTININTEDFKNFLLIDKMIDQERESLDDNDESDEIEDSHYQNKKNGDHPQDYGFDVIGEEWVCRGDQLGKCGFRKQIVFGFMFYIKNHNIDNNSNKKKKNKWKNKKYE